jgi:hypothetical protein
MGQSLPNIRCVNPTPDWSRKLIPGSGESHLTLAVVPTGRAVNAVMLVLMHILKAVLLAARDCSINTLQL